MLTDLIGFGPVEIAAGSHRRPISMLCQLGRRGVDFGRMRVKPSACKRSKHFLFCQRASLLRHTHTHTSRAPVAAPALAAHHIAAASAQCFYRRVEDVLSSKRCFERAVHTLDIRNIADSLMSHRVSSADILTLSTTSSTHYYQSQCLSQVASIKDGLWRH